MTGPGGGGSWIRIAARNNAEWCDIVCRAHGVPGRFDADAWVNPQRTPPYYPDAVTLDPEAVGKRVIARIDTITPGGYVKDSFATLELAAFGFEIVHEAEWIRREPGPAPSTHDADVQWMPLEGEPELTAWETAWDAEGADLGLFVPALLREPSVEILAGTVDGSIVAGAIVNRTGDVVGVSNLFSTLGDLDAAWSGCLAYLEVAHPGSAVVGYEAGEELAAARRQGFGSVGALRIWFEG
jgi:hypothetical protein